MSKGDKTRYFKTRGAFAASNSSLGFKSYYGQVFDRSRFERYYIIKGGPGTGKSRFMRDVAQSCEEQGRYVEYYNCSSDPDSLDAIIIDDRIALLDGTAPHSLDTEIAGARDEIIDLGVFWNSDLLSSRFDEILQLSEKKKSSYIMGYRYLSGCADLCEINDSLISSAIKEKKLLSTVERIVSCIPKGDGFSAIPALFDSIGMKGRVRFDAYESCAKKLYMVADWYSSAHIFLSAVITYAQRRDVALRVSYDPIVPSYPNGVYFCDSGVALVATDPSDTDKDEGTVINMKRFLDKDIIDSVKQRYKYNMRLYDAFVSSACDCFAEAGKYHFDLEDIYLACMDFDAKERFTASFCERIKRDIGLVK